MSACARLIMNISKFLRVRIIVFLLFVTTPWIGIYLLYRSSNVDSGSLGSLVELNDDVGNLEGKAVHIKLYYECLCPDSKKFVVEQLVPTVDKLKDHVSTDLIPYGKATTTSISPGKYTFECQHGELECLGNKVHACTISKVKNYSKLINMIGCMIDDNDSPLAIGEECSKKYGVEWDPINKCTTGDEGMLLLKKYGDQTHSLVPKLMFIPLVIMNGDRSHQDAYLSNLLKKVCEELHKKNKHPTSCKNIH